jgi:hypothetical protein
MREITIYCSGRDQEVRVLVDHDPLYEDERSVLDSALFCCEIGHACTGVACPIGAEPVPLAGATPFAASAGPGIRGTSGQGELQ